MEEEVVERSWSRQGRCRAPDFCDGGQHFPVGMFPPGNQISGDDDGGSMGFDVGTRLPWKKYCLPAALI